MDKSREIENIKEKTGIKNLESTNSVQFEKIQELTAKGEISKEQMKLLVEAIPHFVQLQQTYVDGLKSTINAAKESQKSALEGIANSLESITKLLYNIVDKSETEELRSKIVDIAMKLADYGLEIAKIIHEANKDNNSTWKYIAGGVSACLVLVAGIFLSKK